MASSLTESDRDVLAELIEAGGVEVLDACAAGGTLPADSLRLREACATQLGFRSRIRHPQLLVFESCFGCVKTHLDDAKVSSSKETAAHRRMPITPTHSDPLKEHY